MLSLTKELQTSKTRTEKEFIEAVLVKPKLQVVLEKIMRYRSKNKHSATFARALADAILDTSFLDGQAEKEINKILQPIIKQNNPYHNAESLLRTIDINVPSVNLRGLEVLRNRT